jgi:transketolase
MVALYFGGVLSFNPADPTDPWRDRVLVRGHLGPLRYSIFSLLGWIDEQELNGYRRIGSRLHGHEDHLYTPGVDISPSGSLGMTLSYGVGDALGARDAGENRHTFVFLGDGEEQEGVVSEAARHAAHLQLGNLVAVLDRNGKQLSHPVSVTDSTDHAALWRSYGWRVHHLPDGHDIAAIRDAYCSACAAATPYGTPTILIADTIKGIGIPGAQEHFSGYHTMGRVSDDLVRDAVAAIDATLESRAVARVRERIEAITGESAARATTKWRPATLSIVPTESTPNHPDNCQFDFFTQLRERMDSDVLDANAAYFLTADVTTDEVVSALGLSDMFHFHNVGIREQHMVALAHALSTTRPEARVLINSFDAFTYRCIDQIHAAVQGRGHMTIIGDVAGITNARNGKTHQTIGVPAALLAMDGVTFLEPWDAVDTFACLSWALGEGRGVVYIRVHSSSVHGAPDNNIARTLSYYTVRDTSTSPDLVLFGAGLTVDSCLAAADQLAAEGVAVRVVNVINPKRLDASIRRVAAHGKPLMTVYNGHPATLRSAVADALVQSGTIPSRIESIGFTEGTTGTLDEVCKWAGLDAASVCHASRKLLS